MEATELEADEEKKKKIHVVDTPHPTPPIPPQSMNARKKALYLKNDYLQVTKTFF
jgi:hypothetical protein